MTGTDTTRFRPLGPASEVTEGYAVPYYLNDLKRRVTVSRVQGELYAFDDLCTYEACPLSAGLLSGSTLTCQCHGCQYDVRSGAVLRGPATGRLAVHEVRESDGQVEVRVASVI